MQPQSQHPVPGFGDDIDDACRMLANRAGRQWAGTLDGRDEFDTWRDMPFFQPTKQGLQEGPSLADTLKVLKRLDYEVPSDALEKLHRALSGDRKKSLTSNTQDLLALAHRAGMLAESDKKMSRAANDNTYPYLAALEWRGYQLASELALSNKHASDRDIRLTESKRVLVEHEAGRSLP